METQMTIREAVLDAIADDVESIVQIENYLRCFKSDIEREEVKHILIELLHDEWIHIVHPPKKRLTDFENSYGDAIEFYWFEQTDRSNQ
jgi:predicted DNA-binding protein YlxM (UPF0122 family)